MNHSGKFVGKWAHYLPIYDRHFSAWKDKTITFLEIGVADGGSLQFWRNYFGPSVTVLGIDINPNCWKHQDIAGASIRIGSQADTNFLDSIVTEFGVPDIILDDGSHQQSHVITTFDYFYPKMPKNGVYMVEDLHTAYWEEYGGGLNSPTVRRTFMNYAQECTDVINARHTRGIIEPEPAMEETKCISFYDSVVCFEKGRTITGTITRGSVTS